MSPHFFSHRYLCRISIAALLLALGSPLPASAADYTWTGATGTPNWSNGANWTGNLTPTAGPDTRLIFAPTNSKSSRDNFADGFTLNTILFTASDFNVRGSSLNFAGTLPQLVQTVAGINTLENNLSISSLLTADIQDSNGNLVLSGALSGADAILAKTGLGKLTIRSNTSKTLKQININAGTVALTNNATLSTINGYIALTPASTGTMTVDGNRSTWNNSGSIRIGSSGAGTLTITNGGTVNSISSSLPSSIGFNPGSTGKVSIDGVGSKWNNEVDVYVGHAGTGTLTITNGGTISLITGVIGLQKDSVGSATIDGLGSQWNSTGNIYVGYNGTGTLAITGGGTVNNIFGYIGQFTGSQGSVTVDGAGSTLSSKDTFVGEYGTGTLAITGGGTVNSNYSYIGHNSDSKGSVTVDGSGSSFNSSKSLYIGNDGTGNLTITSAGTVLSGTSSFSSFLGYNTGATGTVTVDGTGSQWSNSGDTFVGESGKGILTITSGGIINQLNGAIGHNQGSQGSASIDGAGSQWNSSGDTLVGYDGTGTLALTGGGVANNEFGYVGLNSGSIGSATVDGANSLWNNRKGLYVGSSGTGTLSIINGARVNSGSIDQFANQTDSFIGSQFGSIGTVNVSGEGSAWNNLTALFIGNFGTGTLTITNGGYATGFYNFIGNNPGSTGKVTVDGVGSKADFAAGLYIGDGGTGMLTITNGGTVTSFNSGIGGRSGSKGSVTVSGAGSLWNNYDFLPDVIEGYFSLGTSGTGSLLITDGGRVNSTNTFMAEGSASQGNATVTGTDSLWNIRKVLYIGYSGTGTLNITNGGTVTVGTSTYINSLSLLSANAGTFNTDTLTGNGKIALTGSGLTLNQASDSTFDGTISGTGNLTKTGAGILTLTTSNTNTGNTTIKQGGITLSTGNFTGKWIELQNSGNLTLTGGATLDLGASGQLRPNTGSTVTYDNATITGGLIYGPGTQSVTGTGATFIGTRFLNSSNLTTNTNTDLIGVVNGGTITATSGANVNLDGFVNDFANNITGQIVVENGATVKASDFGSSGKLTVKTGGTFTNTGTTPLVFGGGSQTYIGSKETPGGTLDSGSKDILLNGGLLVNNGEVTGGGTLNIEYGSTVKGAGDFTGVTVNVADGGIFSPGNSPGTATAGDMIWGAGGTMLWEINDATSVAGTGYDFTDLSGSLTIQSGSTPNSKFTISLSSLLSNDTGGALANFDPTQDYSWTLLHADDGIFGFSSTDVTLNTQLFDVFNPGVLPEHFSVEINDKQDTLQINYVAVNVVVPESNTSLLLLIGIGAGAGYLLLRTRRIPSQEN